MPNRLPIPSITAAAAKKLASVGGDFLVLSEAQALVSLRALRAARIHLSVEESTDQEKIILKKDDHDHGEKTEDQKVPSKETLPA